ncbi:MULTISPECIES: hypothetical protein [Alcaligenes]|uniref:hypothetical protein n=1 Tax=Alcaligenes TaxID=507 RepID=UPI00202F6433|nr:MULTISPECIES: hypothetical protein [Alcaligenes]URW84459.1 hypothetical protein NBV64_08970 [Alcaligenes sp. DN25]WEA69299.1 hypothetical protein PWH35_08995 [Alcaligenes faecalis]
MKTRVNDGGPAYPIADWDYQTFEPKNVEEVRRLLSGMSLRDAFAISALPMCMTAEVDVETAALMAYGMAEAMLRARNTTQGEPDA